MIEREYIQTIADEHLQNTSIYVTKINISTTNVINVLIDGDEGVNIKDCVALSRAIEAKLDREKEDFALEVSSHGATSPIVLPRQYKKHFGRIFQVKLNEGGALEGTLVNMSDDGITLEFSERVNKPIGKGKVTITKQQTVNFNQIKESRIKLKF